MCLMKTFDLLGNKCFLSPKLDLNFWNRNLSKRVLFLTCYVHYYKVSERRNFRSYIHRRNFLLAVNFFSDEMSLRFYRQRQI